MIQVHAVTQVLFLRQRDHLLSLGELVGDRLLAEHGNAAREQLHRRLVVIAAVFLAGRRNAHGIELQSRGEQVGHAVVSGHLVLFRGLVGAFLDDVANGDEFDVLVVLIAAGVHIADAAHAHDRHVYHEFRSIGTRFLDSRNRPRFDIIGTDCPIATAFHPPGSDDHHGIELPARIYHAVVILLYTLAMTAAAIGTINWTDLRAGDCGVIVRRIRDHQRSLPHDHVFHELVYIEAGAADHQTVDGSHPLRPGDLIIIHPQVSHGYANPRRFDLINCLIDRPLMQRLGPLLSPVDGAFDLFLRGRPSRAKRPRRCCTLRRRSVRRVCSGWRP